MRTIFAEYNPQRNSIDVYTSAGYMLRIDCWEAEKDLPVISIPFPNEPKKVIQSLRKTGERIAVKSVVAMPYHASRNRILS